MIKSIRLSSIFLLFIFTNSWGANLHDAAREGNFEQVQCLVENGADVNSKDSDGWTPLHWFTYKGNLKAVNYLATRRGADINSKNEHGETPLHLVVRSKGTLEIVKYLIINGADVDSKALDDWTPLHWSAY